MAKIVWLEKKIHPNENIELSVHAGGITKQQLCTWWFIIVVTLYEIHFKLLGHFKSLKVYKKC